MSRREERSTAAEPDDLIHSRFAQMAGAEPGRPALEFGDDHVSYGQLLESGQRVAASLTALGLAPGSRVAILARRNPGLVTQVLGVLLAGCQFAMLDRTYPRARVRAMIQACRPHAVLDGDRLDKQAGDEAGLSVADPAGNGRPAYVAFTSGTTGTPRCVQGGHAAVAHYLNWSPEAFGLRADDRFSMISGLSHDPFIRDVFSPLSLGAQLFIPDVRTWARPEALAAWMREHRLTVAHLTPTMARRIVLSGRTSLPDLRRVLLGGESVRVADLRSFAQAAPGAEFTVVYGCTETPQVVMHYTATRDDLAAAAAEVLPLGQPAPAAEVELVPASGERGEIVVRSPYLAFGYLRTTGTGLRLEPFGGRYATGDLGRSDAAGRLVFAGRSDRQVKIHGVRVELDEIEHHLRSCPGVLWAAAGVKPSDDDPSVQATVVVRPGVPLRELEVRKYLMALLPAAAVPSVVTVLDQIPVSPNGKSGPSC